DAAKVGPKPDNEAGSDCQEAKENGDRRDGVDQVEIFVPGLCGRREIVTGGCEEAEDSAEKRKPQPRGDTSGAGKAFCAGLRSRLGAVFVEQSAAGAVKRRENHRGENDHATSA